MWKNLKKHNMNAKLHVGSTILLVMVLVLSTQAYINAASTDRNSPPYEPNNPGPMNESTNVSINAQLNWTGGDPDNDNVTYNVFFGTNQTPSQIAFNITATTYNPGSMNFTTKYYWRVIAWDNHSQSTAGPLWMFTTRSNQPPNKPSNPSPAEHALNVSVNANLSWIGGDPDNDKVTYNVYFGTISTPPKVATNITVTTYDPAQMLASTTYYWRIIAWDNQSASTTGDLWTFTTETSLVNVTITKPLPHTLYLNDVAHKFIITTIVFGALTITANATSVAGIKNVTFYIDGAAVKTFTTGPYLYTWDTTAVKGLRHTIKVAAYDNGGNNGSAEINILVWKTHLLPWLLVGAAVATLLIPHTTMKGLVLNLHQTGLRGYTFFALRMHFHTVSLFKNIRGVVKMKRVVVRFAIPPTVIVKLGPPRTLAYLSVIFLGSSMSTLTHPSGVTLQDILPFQGGKQASHSLFSSFMKSMMADKS